MPGYMLCGKCDGKTLSVLREPKGARKGREGAQSGVIKRGGNSITWEVDQPF